MELLFPILIIIHVLICIGLIIVVLMQSAKGEGLAGAFGGGAITGAVFGGRGAASFLSKATTILAVVFMVSCLGLSILSAGRSISVEATDSAVTRTAQEEQDLQQQQGAVPTEGGQEGQSQDQQASPEDIFNQQPTETPTPPEGGGQ